MNQFDLFEKLGLDQVAALDPPFVPVRMHAVPPDVASMPEGDEEQRIAKVKAVLKWLMSTFKTSYSFSGGKDSSALLGLAMSAAAELSKCGETVKPFVILHSNTLVENPNVHAVTKQEISRLRAWIAEHSLPGTVHIATPHLASTFAVSVIGCGKLPSTPETKRECTVEWKGRPLTRLRKAVLGANDIRSGEYVVSVTGVRFSESAARSASMSERGESPLHVVQTHADGSVAIAPIASWSWDDVFMYLGMAANGLEHTYSNFADVIRVYREAMGECVINGSDDDLRASRPCSARTGCWTCLMVKDDKSMDKMLDEPDNAYMRPLAKFRTFLANTFYDLSRRSWVGRTIDPEGYIRFAPDGYSASMQQELLKYAITIQAQEAQAAARIGIAPRFRILTMQELLAIDAMWSLNATARPFTAMKIYRDIVRGANYPVPDAPIFPKPAMPTPRKIFVGRNWDQGQNGMYSGLRDVMLEAFGGEGCVGHKEIKSLGQSIVVMDANTSPMFTVDSEGASLFQEFEMDRMIDMWHGDGRRQATQSGNVAGVAYRYYVQLGVLSVAKSQLGRIDEILRRSAFRERMGLAGYQYEHGRAEALSVPVDATPHSCAQAKKTSQVVLA